MNAMLCETSQSVTSGTYPFDSVMEHRGDGRFFPSNEMLVCKETVMRRRRGREKLKFSIKSSLRTIYNLGIGSQR